MKFVPKAERAEWHEKAPDAAKGADLDSLLELFVETREVEAFGWNWCAARPTALSNK